MMKAPCRLPTALVNLKNPSSMTPALPSPLSPKSAEPAGRPEAKSVEKEPALRRVIAPSRAAAWTARRISGDGDCGMGMMDLMSGLDRSGE